MVHAGECRNDDRLAEYLRSGAAAEVAQDRLVSAARAAERMPRPASTRVIGVANQKGGVGKTTTTVNLAAALAVGGLRVLVVDIDPQGNASTALSVEHGDSVETIYDVLVDDVPMADVVAACPHVEGLTCAPAAIDLAGAEIELVAREQRESLLRNAMDAYLQECADRDERIDFVLIDCPPSLGLLTLNALTAAHEVLIPMQCEYYALEGLSQLLRNIGLVQKGLNPDLIVSSILLTMYDGRTNLSQQVAADVRSHFPDQVLSTSIPRSVRISEAPSFGQTVLTYDPQGSGAICYRGAARELASRGSLL